MISKVQWTYDEVTGKWGARDGSRALSIAWDAGDHALYLSVIVEPAANVEGSDTRVYVAPLSLLAATALLPKSEHGRLLEMLTEALIELRDRNVLGNLQEVIANSIQPWPKPAIASERMRAAADAMPHVERLALDLAAAGAWD